MSARKSSNKALDDLWLVTSMLLFFAGGFFVALEVFTALALLHGGRDLLRQAFDLHRFVALAAASLTLAFWITPLNRFRWLGRSILIGAGLGAFQALTVYASVPERWDLTWQIGIINALLVLAIGAGFIRIANRRRDERLSDIEVTISRPDR